MTILLGKSTYLREPKAFEPARSAAFSFSSLNAISQMVGFCSPMIVISSHQSACSLLVSSICQTKTANLVAVVKAVHELRSV